MALFTKETAAIMAAKGNAVRWSPENRAAKNPAIPAQPPLIADIDAETAYLAKRIVRVREQIEMVTNMIEDESEPQKIDRLASALSRLDEMERILSGRPLPGSRRPAQERQPRSRPTNTEPVEQPQPVQEPPSTVQNVPQNQDGQV